MANTSKTRLKAVAAAGKRRARVEQQQRDATQALAEAVIAARQAGAGPAEIAREGGISRQAVYDMLAGRYGTGRPRGRPRSS